LLNLFILKVFYYRYEWSVFIILHYRKNIKILTKKENFLKFYRKNGFYVKKSEIFDIFVIYWKKNPPGAPVLLTKPGSIHFYRNLCDFLIIYRYFMIFYWNLCFFRYCSKCILTNEKLLIEIVRKCNLLTVQTIFK
jgi:hypothetical protein